MLDGAHTPAGRPRVVVVGAGFGGLAAARRLEGEAVDVTLVDRNNFHTFLPLLYQVATAGLNAADVAYPIRSVFQRRQHVAFRQASVTGVDWDTRQVLVDHGSPLPFDHLIVAAGSAPEHFGTPGAAEHGLPLYSLAQAARLRNHVLRCFEDADADPAHVDDGSLTFVVVGGGPTGVEVAGALAELIDKVLARDFHTLDARRARVVLVEAAPVLLGPFSPRSQRFARRVLTWRGVDVRLGVTVERVEADRVHLTGGEIVPTRTLVWAAGVRANPVADVLGVEQGRAGRIVVGTDLAIVGRPDAYAVGDIADMLDVGAAGVADMLDVGAGVADMLDVGAAGVADMLDVGAAGVADMLDVGAAGVADPRVAGEVAGSARLPQLAQVAMQGGEHAAEQVLRRIAGEPITPFRYTDKGIMATIGRRAAVAELPFGVKLTGMLAWLAWLGLHLVELMGMRNRASVFVNWAWNYLTWDRGPRLIFAGAADGTDTTTSGEGEPGPPT